jgi:hypothetical protein
MDPASIDPSDFVIRAEHYGSIPSNLQWSEVEEKSALSQLLLMAMIRRNRASQWLGILLGRRLTVWGHWS